MNDFQRERIQSYGNQSDHNSDLQLKVDSLNLLRERDQSSDDAPAMSTIAVKDNAKALLTIGSVAVFYGLGEGVRSVDALNEAKYAVKYPRTNPDLFCFGNAEKKFTEAVRECSTLHAKLELKSDRLYPAQVNLEAAFDEAREVIQTYRNAFQKGETFAGVSPELAMKRHEFLTKTGLWRLGSGGRTADQYIGSLTDVENSSKLFVEGTREANMIRGLVVARRVESQLQKSLAELSDRYSIKKTEVLAMKDEIMKSSSKSAFIQGFKSGSTVTGACLLAGHLADKAIGIESSSNSLPRAALDGFVVPTILLSNLPKPTKIAISATSFGISRAFGLTNNRKEGASEEPAIQFNIASYSENQIPSAYKTMKGLSRIEG